MYIFFYFLGEFKVNLKRLQRAPSEYRYIYIYGILYNFHNIFYKIYNKKLHIIYTYCNIVFPRCREIDEQWVCTLKRNIREAPGGIVTKLPVLIDPELVTFTYFNIIHEIMYNYAVIIISKFLIIIPSSLLRLFFPPRFQTQQISHPPTCKMKRSPSTYLAAITLWRPVHSCWQKNQQMICLTATG